jgi:hypothetical protein
MYAIGRLISHSLAHKLIVSAPEKAVACCRKDTELKAAASPTLANFRKIQQKYEVSTRDKELLYANARHASLLRQSLPLSARHKRNAKSSERTD